MSREESLQYLRLREIDKEQAARIYELVGGRLIQLESIADQVETNGEPFGISFIVQA